ELQVLRQALLREDPPEHRGRERCRRAGRRRAERPDREDRPDRAARPARGQDPMTTATAAAARDVESTVEGFTADLGRLRQEISTMIVGQETIIEGVLMCL